MSNGKWYWEFKMLASVLIMIGVNDANSPSSYENNDITQGVFYRSNNGNKYLSGSATSFGNSYTTNDILGIALDMDNKKVYFSKNGTYQNSGDPTSGATGTGALSVSSFSSMFATVLLSDGSSSAAANFGNPPYAVSSSNADANGHGNFEYAVPSGYFALCSKNLAKYG